jgi:UDP-4-amino-4,6-dideoxy-N-acetyl-beta-L-altrosamine N-acetyltransferase
MIVALERISQADKNSLRTWRNDPAVSKWMYTNHEIGEAEHNVWFDNMLVDDSKVYWKIVVDGVAVGTVLLTGVVDDALSYEWGMYLADVDVRGKGVAQAACALSFRHAFENLGVSAVRCEAVAQNETAIGLYESVGYVRTGLKEDAVLRGNEMLSVVTLELTREAWTARKDHVLQRLSEKGVNIHG